MSAGAIEQLQDNQSRPIKPLAAKIRLKAIELTSRIEADPQKLFSDVVDDNAAQQSNRPGLLSDGETISFAMLADRINRYARWAPRAGIRKSGKYREMDSKACAGIVGGQIRL